MKICLVSDVIECNLDSNAPNKMGRAYYELKKQYKLLSDDYCVMKECRNRYRLLYLALKDEKDNGLFRRETGEEKKSMAGSERNLGAYVFAYCTLLFIESTALYAFCEINPKYEFGTNQKIVPIFHI